MAQKAAVPKPKRTTVKSALKRVEKKFPELSHSRQRALARKMALLDKLKMHGKGLRNGYAWHV